MRHSCLATFFVIIFVLTAPAALILFNLKNSLFNPSFLKTALQKAQIYEKAAGLAPGIVEEAFEKESKITDLKKFSQVVSQAITASYLQKQTEGLIEATLGWIRGTQPNLLIQISVLPIKEAIKAADPQLNEYAEKLPDSYNYDQNKIASPFALGLPRSFRIFTWLIYLFGGVAFLTILILVLFSFRSARSLLRWVGMPLFLTSVPLLVMSTMTVLIIDRYVSSQRIITLTGTPTSMKVYDELVQPIVNALTGPIASTIQKQTLIIAGISLLFIILSFFFKKMESKAIPKPVTK